MSNSRWIVLLNTPDESPTPVIRIGERTYGDAPAEPTLVIVGNRPWRATVIFPGLRCIGRRRMLGSDHTLGPPSSIKACMPVERRPDSSLAGGTSCGTLAQCADGRPLTCTRYLLSTKAEGARCRLVPSCRGGRP